MLCQFDDRLNILTRHRASTSMYSLTFCVRVTTPPQYGRNGMAHAAGASILSSVRGVFAARRTHAYCVRRAAEPDGLPLGSATQIHSVAIATQPVHRLQIHPTVHNSGAFPTTPPSYILVRAIVWACGCGQTHRQTDTQTRVTTIHFAKCAAYINISQENTY